jgi:hypothetical protein
MARGTHGHSCQKKQVLFLSWLKVKKIHAGYKNKNPSEFSEGFCKYLEVGTIQQPAF